jgi:signal transduction histidine kinase
MAQLRSPAFQQAALRLAALSRYFNVGGSESLVQSVLERFVAQYPSLVGPIVSTPGFVNPDNVHDALNAALQGAKDHFHREDAVSKMLLHELRRAPRSVSHPVLGRIRLALGTPARSMQPLTEDAILKARSLEEDLKREMNQAFNTVIGHVHDIRNIMTSANIVGVLLQKIEEEPHHVIQEDLCDALRWFQVFFIDLIFKLNSLLDVLYALRKAFKDSEGFQSFDWRKECLRSFEDQRFAEETIQPLRDCCQLLNDIAGDYLKTFDRDFSGYIEKTGWLDLIAQYLKATHRVLQGSSDASQTDSAPMDLVLCIESEEINRILKEFRVSRSGEVGFHQGLVRGSEIDLISIFSNLVKNACEAMEGHVTKQIIINATEMYLSDQDIEGYANSDLLFVEGSFEVGPYLVTEITDHGPGFPREKWANMHEPHYSHKPGKESSTGVGLTTVMNLLKKIPGAVLVIKTGSEGTTTAVCLPKFYSRNSMTPRGMKVVSG